MVARTRLIPALILLYIGNSIGSMRLAHKDAKYNVEHRGSGRDCGAVDLGCAVREDVLAKCGAGRRPVCPGTFHSRGAGEGHREGPKPWARRSGGSSRESGRTQRPIEPGTRPGSRPRSSFFARSGPGSEEVLSNNPDHHSCFQTPSECFSEVLLSTREKSSLSHHSIPDGGVDHHNREDHSKSPEYEGSSSGTGSVGRSVEPRGDPCICKATPA